MVSSSLSEMELEPVLSEYKIELTGRPERNTLPLDHWDNPLVIRSRKTQQRQDVYSMLD